MDPRKTILLMYLCHHPSHTFDVARKFKEALEKGKWMEPKTLVLTRPNKLYPIFEEMTNGGLVQLREMRGEKGWKKVYQVRPDIFFGSAKIRIEEVPRLKPTTVSIEECIRAIQALSRSKLECIARIGKLKKFDEVSLLLYFNRLLGEILWCLLRWRMGRKFFNSLSQAEQQAMMRWGLVNFKRTKGDNEFIENAYLDLEKFDEVRENYPLLRSAFGGTIREDTGILPTSTACIIHALRERLRMSIDDLLYKERGIEQIIFPNVVWTPK